MKKVYRDVAGMFAAVALLLSASSARAMPSYVTNVGTWTQGNAFDTYLGSINNEYCYLTAVTGRFAGGGEQVHVYLYNGNWYLGGSSQQQGVAATATCIDTSVIKTEAGGVNYWTGSAYTYPNPSCYPWGCSQSGSVNLWQGDAAIMLAGITGEFDGGGESVSVSQSADPWGYNTLNARSQSPNSVGGWAQTLFVGVPQSGFVPAFYGPNGGPLPLNQAGSFAMCTTSGCISGQWMVEASLAFCYLSQIGGAFYGSGESVEIIPVTDTCYPLGSCSVDIWAIYVNSKQPNGTSATATCLALDQSKSM